MDKGCLQRMSQKLLRLPELAQEILGNKKCPKMQKSRPTIGNVLRIRERRKS